MCSVLTSPHRSFASFEGICKVGAF